MTEVAATHADALDVEVRALWVRRAVLRAVATREPTTPEMDGTRGAVARQRLP
ncbi:hypothetical protein [Nocardia sp. MW-W600-9]